MNKKKRNPLSEIKKQEQTNKSRLSENQVCVCPGTNC